MALSQHPVRAEQIRRDMNAAPLELGHEFRPDSGGAELADDAAIGLRRASCKSEDLLHSDDVAFHAGDLLEADQAAAAIAHALQLQDNVEGGGSLGAHAADRHV